VAAHQLLDFGLAGEESLTNCRSEQAGGTGDENSTLFGYYVDRVNFISLLMNTISF
jgi:hypothetical protein